MAAENAPHVPHTEPNPAEPQLLAVAKPKAPLPLLVTTEKTPLVLKVDTSRRVSAEEVHPLPWFRSPEWSRTSPPATGRGAGGQKRSRLAGRRSSRAGASSGWWCLGGGSSTRDRDVELGYGYSSRRTALAAAADDADGFRQCVQLLVALVIVVAIALILMIILQPFRDGSDPDELGVASGGW